ncbi:MAG: uncharacterized membrane protein (DUF106 family) [Candidatus Nanohaloarchaea archaeon]|jgi:uncharacterized membrane protein (DUF106 family)
MVSIQGILTALFGFYDTVFQPVLSLGPYLSLAVFSGMLAGVFSVIYWILLDIEKNKKLKEKISNTQEKMKEARKNDNTDKASDHMQKTMELNQKMMMLNFKPMIATMVFVGLIFPWLGATFAPTIEMTQVDNTTYTGNFSYAGETTRITVINETEPVLQVNGEEINQGEKFRHQGISWNFQRFGESSGGFLGLTGSNGITTKLAAVFIPLPFSIPLAGTALNWLGFYILIAMPLTFIFRKALGVQ